MYVIGNIKGFYLFKKQKKKNYNFMFTDFDFDLAFYSSSIFHRVIEIYYVMYAEPLQLFKPRTITFDPTILAYKVDLAMRLGIVGPGHFLYYFLPNVKYEPWNSVLYCGSLSAMSISCSGAVNDSLDYSKFFLVPAQGYGNGLAGLGKQTIHASSQVCAAGALWVLVY